MDVEKHKKCFKCGETKPLSDFYKHFRMADGHVNKCKECNKKDVRENRKDKSSYYNTYDKLRGQDKLSPRMTNRRETAKAIARSSNPRREMPLIDQDTKKNATTKVHNAVRDGRLERQQQCFCCGSTYHVHAHHSSYDKDMWLVITWLCASCHSRLHKDFEYLTGPYRTDMLDFFK